jgi:geranylgeranyl pyrophosphate synthase
MTICSGEIEEYFASASDEGNYQSYLRRIGKKTASLISMASESGAILSGASEETITALRNYGYDLGIAFQIVDDILDFTGEAEEMGKPVGSDLTQGILTLPAILFLEQNLEKRGDREAKEIYEAIKESSVIQQSYDIAERYSSKACEFLTALPDGASRQALFELAEYVVQRQK